MRELSVTVACEKAGAVNESAVFYKLSQVGEIKREAAGNNKSRVCFGSTGMAACYELKEKCLEGKCQEAPKVIVDNIKIQGRLSKGLT